MCGDREGGDGDDGACNRQCARQCAPIGHRHAALQLPLHEQLPHAAAQKANIQVRVVVCFSAHNMVTVAQKLKPRLVIADNDASGTGERVAIQIGAPYWMSETVGNDFNDDHKQRGLFAVSNDLRKLFIRRVNA